MAETATYLELKKDNPLDAAHSAAQTLYYQGPGANNGALECERFATLRLTLAVLSATGTSPTLDVTLEHSSTASGPWVTLGTFAQKTSAVSERKVFAGCDRFVRVRWAIGGTTPAFRFNIIGEAI